LYGKTKDGEKVQQQRKPDECPSNAAAKGGHDGKILNLKH
jgi:hypothetical protein